jgi:hypothetical protein
MSLLPLFNFYAPFRRKVVFLVTGNVPFNRTFDIAPLACYNPKMRRTMLFFIDTLPGWTLKSADSIPARVFVRSAHRSGFQP